MKLEQIEIKNYRSVFHDYDSDESFTLNLGDGMNAIVGPNNAGKSNIFRALTLALDDGCEFDRTRDQPAPFKGVKPSVLLTFRIPTSARGPEGTLLRYLEEYESTLNEGRRTYASQGLAKLRVTIEGTGDSPGTRREVFVARGVGARSLPRDSELLTKALDQFQKCFHFVAIKSGESLESLLEGKFRDILRNVLRDNLRAAFEAAEQSRRTYLSDLQSGLLAPLTSRIGEELRDLFPEISGVELSPEVLSLDETLTRMRVDVSDVAMTDLAEKGTGVRGGLIVAMLRHFADTGKRSMLFMVEEPESFLHPAAQEQLREDLEALAERPDVSLIVTTHSPYIPSRDPDARVFSIAKDKAGATRLLGSASGKEPRAALLSGLFRDRLFMEWLDRSTGIDDDTKLTLVVEGTTDVVFAQLGLELAGRTDLLDGISFLEAGAGLEIPAGGTSLAVMQALLAQATSSAPVAALFDNDAPGVTAQTTLKDIGSKNGVWRAGKTVFSYLVAFPGADSKYPFEAEDLWPGHLLKAFVDADPDQRMVGQRRIPPPIGGWHFDIVPAEKGNLVEHLRATATAEDCSRWVDLYTAIRQRAGIDRA